MAPNEGSVMLKFLATLSALAIIGSVSSAQGPPPGFGNPRDSQPGPGPVIVEKRCSNCNHVVSSSSKPGDTCPFCGTKWAEDEGNRSKANTPRPAKAAVDLTEGSSVEKNIGRFAIVIAGLAVSALIVTLTVRFLMSNMWHNI
jgi:hypothetical protein